MKKMFLLISMFLIGYASSAQECGSYIELIGHGIAGQDAASIQLDNPDQIDSIVAEVFYKSYTAPNQISLWSANEAFLVDPVVVPISGLEVPGLVTSVYRASFVEPASEINLDILANSSEFYSMALYVYRKGENSFSKMEGEHYFVNQNEDSPLMTDIPLEVSDHPRDITLRFGITELNMDERWAEFIFEANGEIKSLEVWEWDTQEGETESYTIREVTFTDVPGEVDHIKMTMLSEKHLPDTRTGDSYFAGVVLVDLPCEYEESEGYCSYTQGYYGNEGGKTCKGESTRELLARLLVEDLILGEDDYTFIIPAGSVDCVLDLLPGGGPSKALGGAFSCEDLGDIATNKQGRLKNTLLAQGITLALNLRNSPGLMTFPVDGMEFYTRKTEDCSNPESEGIYGTEQSHAFGKDLVDYLGVDATIADLLDLVNKALAGHDISPLGLSNVADAAALVNEAFDECVVVLNPGNGEPSVEPYTGEDGDYGDDNKFEGVDGELKGATGVTDANFEASLSLYPNPTQGQLHIQALEAALYSLEISNLNGQVIYKSEFNGTLFQTDLSSLKNGVYFLKISSDAHVSTRKIVKQ